MNSSEELEKNHNNSIEIVDSSPNDERAIYEVVRETRLDSYPNEEYGVTKEDIASMLLTKGSEKYEQIMKKREENSGNNPNFHTWVAKDHNEVIGFCLVVKHEDANEVKSIYVLPKYQGKGIGKALMVKAFDWVDKEKPLKLGVVVYNTQARNFYRKLGFVETGRPWHNENPTPTSGKQIPSIEMIKTFD